MRGCATSNYNFCYIHIHGSENYIIHVITSFYRPGYIEPLTNLNSHCHCSNISTKRPGYTEHISAQTSYKNYSPQQMFAIASSNHSNSCENITFPIILSSLTVCPTLSFHVLWFLCHSFLIHLCNKKLIIKVWNILLVKHEMEQLEENIKL